MKSVQKALLLLALPFIELVSLRFYLRDGLGLRVGWRYVTDFDLVVPAFLAFVILIYCYEKIGSQPLVLRKKMLAANLAAFFMFGLGNYLLQGALGNYSFVVQLLWWSTVLFILVSALCVFVPPAYFFSARKLPLLTLAGFLAMSVVLNANFMTWIWPVLMKPVGWGARAISQWFASSPVQLLPSDSAVILSGADFAVKINQGCGGGDAFLFFIFCYGLFLMNFGRAYSLFEKILFAVEGLITMAFLNILRIGLLFAMGSNFSWDGRLFGHTQMFKWVAHAQLGWVLYFLGLYCLFRVFLARQSAKYRSSVLPRMKAAQG